MRDFTLPWGLLLGLVRWLCLSYPQPLDRSPHGCTVGIDGDPPVWPSTQAGWWRYQSASSCVRGLRGCGSGCTACVQWWTFCGAALSDFPQEVKIFLRLTSEFNVYCISKYFDVPSVSTTCHLTGTIHTLCYSRLCTDGPDSLFGVTTTLSFESVEKG